MTEKQKNEILFMQFVMGLSHSGMMQLGKVMNPMTQKIEKDLNGAQATIDFLVALREKTKGNLCQTEEDMLTNSISSLQMNYIDEIKEKPAKPEVDKTDEADEADEADKTDEADETDKTDGTDAKN